MHLSKLFALAAVAAAALAAQTASASAPFRGASPERALPNSATFQDSTGENPPGPDITAVTVSNNDAGTITWDIRIPNRSSVTPETLIVLYVDADNNAATGDVEFVGADYAIELFVNQITLYKWDGSTYSRRGGDPPQVSLIFAPGSTGVRITINASELGATRRLNFGVLAASGIAVDEQTGDLDFSNAYGDAAPDGGHGFWSYDVRTAPLRLVARRFRAGAARAGRPYTVRLTAARSDTGAVLRGGQVRCAATIAGARLAARTRRFVGSEAVCGWQLPATARGKRIRGTITVVFEGRSVRRSFSATVR